ncbi:MAG: lipopolysaccharide kinase InaA family protein [Planctomycetota bacterium]
MTQDEIRTTRRTPRGRVEFRAVPGFRGAEELVDECLRWDVRRSGVWRTIAGEELALKGGPLASRGVRRHGLRRALLAAPAPCEAERRNLEWLSKRLFRCAEPVASVTLRRRGAPVQQLLATRWVAGADPFDDAWQRAADPERRALAEEVGREVGRMHALRFLHGDLYPRNALVTQRADDGGPGHGRRIVWIDAWAAGPTAWRRGAPYRVERDLGAWFSEAADWMDRAQQDQLLTAYADARAANGRPIPNLDTFLQRIRSARRAELAKLEREPRRLRGRPFPIAGWDPNVDLDR